MKLSIIILCISAALALPSVQIEKRGNAQSGERALQQLASTIEQEAQKFGRTLEGAIASLPPMSADHHMYAQEELRLYNLRGMIDTVSTNE